MNCTALNTALAVPRLLARCREQERDHARTMTLTLPPEKMPDEMAEAASRINITGQELFWQQQQQTWYDTSQLHYARQMAQPRTRVPVMAGNR
jgi:hypothetical protein